MILCGVKKNKRKNWYEISLISANTIYALYNYRQWNTFIFTISKYQSVFFCIISFNSLLWYNYVMTFNKVEIIYLTCHRSILVIIIIQNNQRKQSWSLIFTYIGNCIFEWYDKITILQRYRYSFKLWFETKMC